MASQQSNELPWIARALLTVGLIAFLALIINFLSGGAIWNAIQQATAERPADSSGPVYVAPEPVVDDEPSQAEIEEAMRMPWDCYWDPTMNENWHDDVICRDGVDAIRPILLPDQNFVTEDEMRAAGDAYEAELNAGR